jgi:hypothetical protein
MIEARVDLGSSANGDGRSASSTTVQSLLTRVQRTVPYGSAARCWRSLVVVAVRVTPLDQPANKHVVNHWNDHR